MATIFATPRAGNGRLADRVNCILVEVKWPFEDGDGWLGQS